MKKNTARNLYSFAAALFFIIIAAGSAKVNKIHCGAFSREQTGEEKGGQGYLVLEDGKRISGSDFSWKSGAFVKDQIKVDGEKYKIIDTRGYYSNGSYYARLGKIYAKRIVHGKLNVYYTEEIVTTNETVNGRLRTRSRLVCKHYVQVGENGVLEAIANQKDIIRFVQDCPAAVEMIDKKDKAIRKAIKKDRFYMNQVFVTYNNCK